MKMEFRVRSGPTQSQRKLLRQTLTFTSATSNNIMTTVLPITPRTPSSLLAALCLSPVLAPLNASHDSSPSTDIPRISLLSPAPAAPIVPAQAVPLTNEVVDLRSPLNHTVSFGRGSGPRLLSHNEARQLTLLMVEYLHPVRTSTKRLMQKSIDLAEILHRHGIRWDRQRRVMGIHIRSLWEQGLRLTGEEESVLRLSRPGPMESVFPLQALIMWTLADCAQHVHPKLIVQYH